MDLFQSIVNSVIVLMEIIFGVVIVIYFLVYGMMFLAAKGDPAKVSTAKQGLLYGVVGVVVGALALVIVNVIAAYFGL